MWNERYSAEAYAFGTQPNDFLASMLDRLPKGKALCLAEGEGRNAVWLAEHGWDVTAVDVAEVGLAKAQQLAAERDVSINTIHADLADFEIGAKQWDLIVSVFCHLPLALRQRVHAACVSGLNSGGAVLLEAYTPLQLEYKTGGPPVVDLMMTAEALEQEFDGLRFEHLNECVRDVTEGQYHTGDGAVVQMFATKP